MLTLSPRLNRRAVKDARCLAVSSPEVKCQSIDAQSGDIVEEKGPIYGSGSGGTFFIFNGSANGKIARCEASKPERGAGSATAEPTWYGAAYVTVQIVAAGETPTPCRPPE